MCAFSLSIAVYFGRFKHAERQVSLRCQVYKTTYPPEGVLWLLGIRSSPASADVRLESLHIGPLAPKLTQQLAGKRMRWICGEDVALALAALRIMAFLQTRLKKDPPSMLVAAPVQALT